MIRSFGRYGRVAGGILCVAECEGEDVVEWAVYGCYVGCGKVRGDER